MSLLHTDAKLGSSQHMPSSFVVVVVVHRDTSANMSDHTTSGTLLQELVPFALALKLMLHELSMSLQRLTSGAHPHKPFMSHPAVSCCRNLVIE
jgi:hypothetical protein